ncbi:hypothetical protein C8Q79DRAFT_87815 [Trametes meyenii]|nr:hypothetical protein C8Q79DRAFT_87815 [Trametes meyenii]
MTIPAALRHERENSKHQAKLAEEELWDWSRKIEPDWTTPTVPQGESAWEWEPSTRLTAFIEFWLDGVAASERGELVRTMDGFISGYDKEYQEENWPEKYEDWNDEEEEWAAEYRDGVAGYWCTGGSFEPCSSGYNDDDFPWVVTDECRWVPPPEAVNWKPLTMSYHSEESITRRALAEKWWPDDPDPRLGWEPIDEPTPWTSGPGAAAPASRPSDATPTQETSEKTASQTQETKPRRRNRNRHRGRGRGKQGAAKGQDLPDATTRRFNAHRDQRAKMY